MSLEMTERAGRAHAYLDNHWDAHLAHTRAFLRQPSISAQGVGLRATADWLRGELSGLGAQLSYHGNESQPIVLAEWEMGAPRTLLVYGMYDVQPVDDQPWTTPPFAAEIHSHPEDGDSIFARGACNSKGPLMALLHAVEALRVTGGLPVNLKWTIEGEEEIGSPVLPEFYALNRARLRADAAFEPFWSQTRPGSRPLITLGTKGVIGLTFICRSGEWGGPREAIHSSYGAILGSPAWRLVQALHSLVDQHQHLAVDDVPALGELRAGDEDLLAELVAATDPADVLAELGAKRLKQDLTPLDAARLNQFAPALNINGLQSGYLGAGSHTIIPNSARALCDLRLPPGLTVDDTVAALHHHLARRGFGDIEITLDSGYPAARTPAEAPVVQALQRAYRAHGYEPLVRPVEPSATPYYLFTEVLGLNFAWGGLGSAGGSHGPDEWCSLSGLRDMQKSLATFLIEFGSGV